MSMCDLQFPNSRYTVKKAGRKGGRGRKKGRGERGREGKGEKKSAFIH